MLKKIMDVFEVWMNMQGIIILLALIMWLLNGGKNDNGLIHSTAVNMMITVVCMMGLMLIGFGVASITDLFGWLFNRLRKQENK